MHSDALLALIYNISAMTAIAFAFFIFVHSTKNIFQKALIFVLLFLFASFTASSFSLSADAEMWSKVATVSFAFFFLSLIICFYVFRFVDYQLISAKDKIALRGIFYAILASIFFSQFDGDISEMPVTQQLSSYSGLIALVFLHHMSRLYCEIDKYNFLNVLKIDLGLILFSAVTSFALFLSGVLIFSLEQFLTSAAVILSCLQALSIIYLLMNAGGEKRVLAQYGRIAQLSRQSIPHFIRDLSQLNIFKSIKVINMAQVEQMGFEAVEVVLKPLVVYNPTYVKHILKTQKIAKDERASYEAILKLLSYREAQALIQIRVGEDILCFRQQPLSSDYLFQAVLQHVVLILADLNEIQLQNMRALGGVAIQDQRLFLGS